MEQFLQKLSKTFYYKDGKLLYRGGPYQKADTECGWVNWSGYHLVSFERKHYKTHRLIFAMHHGYLPKLIDHIDRNKLNNKIENLKDSSKSENALNSKRSEEGGVSWVESRKKWRAYIKRNYKQIFLGYYSIKDHALIAVKTERKYSEQV